VRPRILRPILRFKDAPAITPIVLQDYEPAAPAGWRTTTARSAHGFQLESRTDTQAVITRKGLVAGLLERAGLNGRKRQVISVDEHGAVTAQPAEPVRW
jgi:hypothetical protein